ncbi:MAG: hypothetical protein GAK30_00630 [Paracidovorax wautersii]|uniref:HTH tetR-type domain-containing protein n=1 Tax=Paracidovorax wautersii TaxID=1177982 RepID=A0A7V8JRF0_9BURK|nr:MAG: hypothetical protein GAK30_00630 [Paracidovorax wautersii]
MSKKPPRRTAERILEVALDLCNRFGMTNVSTTQIASEMRISPGNLYYHYASKDDLINKLFDQHECAVLAVLRTSDLVRDLPATWSFCEALFGCVWQYRFIYRDLNHLLANNRRIETHMQVLLAHKQTALQEILAGLRHGQSLQWSPDEAQEIGAGMLLVLMYWLSYEYVQDPRQMVGLLVPYLPAGARQQLDEWAQRHVPPPAWPAAAAVQDAVVAGRHA